MTARMIDGSQLAAGIRDSLTARVESLKAAGKRAPCLALVLVGDDPGSHAYVGMKDKMAAKAGLVSRKILLEASVSEADVAAVIEGLARDDGVDGILLQLPLPARMSAERLIEHIPPAKDVDGLTVQSQGLLALGRPGLRPCTPVGIVKLIESTGRELAGARVAVVGQSTLVGASTAQLLRAKRATVINIRRTEKNPEELTRLCDVVVVATGQRGLVGCDWFKPGAVVIDVGNTRTSDGKVYGDVRFDEVVKQVGWITPVPGGVGPMTIACLLENVVQAAEDHLGR